MENKNKKPIQKAKSEIKNVKAWPILGQQAAQEARKQLEDVCLKPLLTYREELTRKIEASGVGAIYLELGIVNARIEEIRKQLGSIIS